MKKILAAVVLIALLFTSAYAVNWSDIEPQIAETGLEGGFVAIDPIGLRMWVPDTLQRAELSDTDRSEGYIAYFANGDGSNAAGVLLYDIGMNQGEYLKWLHENGCADAKETTVNGSPMITYSYDMNGTPSRVFSLVNGSGLCLEFAFTAGDEAFEQTAAIMAASVQPDADEVE